MIDPSSQRPRRVGHKGAAHIEQGNTLASFDAALRHDVDMIELDVDIKLPGYELRVLDALRAHDLVERTLVSGMFPSGLARIRAAEPDLRLGWSVPRVRRDYTTDVLTAIPALAMLTGYRAALPRRARGALLEGRFDAIMAHWRVVTRRLVHAVAEGGGELYVWTVDDARMIERLSAMGVDGIITNDPRLFSR